MQDTDFLTVEDHFELFIDGLNTHDLKGYRGCKHTRTETAYKGRNFLVYKMVDGKPVELDRIVVNDFSACDEYGASTSLVSLTTKQTLTVGYAPMRVFDYPLFVWIPLHSKLRWATTQQAMHKGSLGFPLNVRTRSRFGLRETHVT